MTQRLDLEKTEFLVLVMKKFKKSIKMNKFKP